jgi:hypothetical protein
MASAQASSAAAGVARGPSGEGLIHQAFGLLVEHRSRVLAGIAAVSIVVGGALYLAGEHMASWGLIRSPEPARPPGPPAPEHLAHGCDAVSRSHPQQP